MPDISVQFYATESALAQWLLAWASTDDVTLVGMCREPFSVTKIRPDEVARTIGDRQVWRFLLYQSNVVLGARSKHDFENANENGLVLDVGRISTHGLSESWLACRTKDAAAYAKWRRIANDLKSKTIAGITATNRLNGGSAFYKSFRYSKGAAELQASGTSMIPIQGVNGPIIRLGNVTGRQK